MLPLIACVAYAVAGGFLLLAGSLIWTILMFLCRWIDELAKVRRSRGTDLEMEDSCSITPLILQPRRGTPRYAPHPPRCSCPVHVSRNWQAKQYADLERSMSSSQSSISTPFSILLSSEDDVSGCTRGFETLWESRGSHLLKKQQELFTTANVSSYKLPSLNPDSRYIDYDLPKTLSIAHSTIIQRRPGIFVSESEEEDDGNHSTSGAVGLAGPPILWTFPPSLSKIGSALADGLVSRFSSSFDKSGDERESADDITSLQRIADAFRERERRASLSSNGSQFYSRSHSHTDRYRDSLARSSKISAMKYEGGYKQGLHTAAYRSHLLKTGKSASSSTSCIKKVFACRTSVTTSTSPKPSESLIVTVVPRNESTSNSMQTIGNESGLQIGPVMPPGLDTNHSPPVPGVLVSSQSQSKAQSRGTIGRGHRRAGSGASQENLPPLPAYGKGALAKVGTGRANSLPLKAVDEPASAENCNKRRREVLGLKVMNQ